MYIKRPVCVLSLGFLLFMYIALLFYPPQVEMDRVTCDLEDWTSLTVYGTVERKEYGDQKAVIYLKNVSIKIQISDTSIEKDIRTCHGFILYLSQKENKKTDVINIGSYICAEGKLQKFSVAENEGQFDTRNYYYERGYVGSLLNADIIAQSKSYNIPAEFLYQLREQIKKVYAKYMDKKYAAIMQALVLGDRTELDSDVKDLYRKAGISHILSLSGVKMLLLALMKHPQNRTNTAFLDMTCGNKYIIIQYILGTIMRCCRSHSICGVIFKKYILAKGCTFWRKYKQLSKSKITKGVSAYGLQRI